MLEFLFAGDCVVDVLELLAVDQTGDLVAGGEGSGGLLAVFDDALAESVGEADVEGARAAGKDVNPELIVVL